MPKKPKYSTKESELRKRLTQHRAGEKDNFSPPDSMWDNIESALVPPKKKRRGGWWFLYLGLFIILGAGFFGVQYLSSSSQDSYISENASPPHLSQNGNELQKEVPTTIRTGNNNDKTLVDQENTNTDRIKTSTSVSDISSSTVAQTNKKITSPTENIVSQQVELEVKGTQLSFLNEQKTTTAPLIDQQSLLPNVPSIQKVTTKSPQVPLIAGLSLSKHILTWNERQKIPIHKTIEPIRSNPFTPTFSVGFSPFMAHNIFATQIKDRAVYSRADRFKLDGQRTLGIGVEASYHIQPAISIYTGYRQYKVNFIADYKIDNIYNQSTSDNFLIDTDIPSLAGGLTTSFAFTRGSTSIEDGASIPVQLALSHGFDIWSIPIGISYSFFDHDNISLSTKGGIAYNKRKPTIETGVIHHNTTLIGVDITDLSIAVDSENSTAFKSSFIQSEIGINLNVALSNQLKFSLESQYLHALSSIYDDRYMNVKLHGLQSRVGLIYHW